MLTILACLCTLQFPFQWDRMHVRSISCWFMSCCGETSSGTTSHKETGFLQCGSPESIQINHSHHCLGILFANLQEFLTKTWYPWYFKKLMNLFSVLQNYTQFSCLFIQMFIILLLFVSLPLSLSVGFAIEMALFDVTVDKKLWELNNLFSRFLCATY